MIFNVKKVTITLNHGSIQREIIFISRFISIFVLRENNTKNDYGITISWRHVARLKDFRKNIVIFHSHSIENSENSNIFCLILTLLAELQIKKCYVFAKIFQRRDMVPANNDVVLIIYMINQ